MSGDVLEILWDSLNLETAVAGHQRERWKLLPLELKRTSPTLNPCSRPCLVSKVCLDAVVILSSTWGFPSWHVFLGTGTASSIKLPGAVSLDLAFNQQRAWLTLGAMQSAKIAVPHFARKPVGIAKSIPRRRAGDRRQPLAVESIGRDRNS
jgi:hypothetical protein